MLLVAAAAGAAVGQRLLTQGLQDSIQLEGVAAAAAPPTTSSAADAPVTVVATASAPAARAAATTSSPSSGSRPAVQEFSATSLQDLSTASAVSEGTGATKVGDAGTVLGSSRVAAPAGAKYVATNGSDSAAGAVGAPWRTLAHAVASSPSGSTIVLRAGTYRESVTWYGKQLTIQNYPGESVWLSGAVAVSGWTADGTSRWYADGWTTKFPRTTSSTFVDPALNPYAGYPDMVFVNGVAQRQVGSRTAVVAGTFFVDYAAARIYLGSDPTGKSVEASKYSRALYLNHANGSVVRGIGIQRYASEPDGMGALFVQANSTTVADVIVRQSAAVGVSVIGQGNVISSSVMKDNGQIGVHGDRANGLSVRSTILQNNNNERFKAGHAQGGLKLTSSTGVLVKDCLVRWNRGRGLWFDISSYDIDVVNNVVVGNGDRGIMVEISAKAVVAGNVVASNGAEGIMISESRDVDVYNNSLWYNARSISVVENSRTSSSSAIPYNVGDVVVRNNLISTARSGTSQLVSTEDTTRSKSAGAMGVSMDYDAYHTASSRVPTWLIGWANYPSGYGVFKDVKTFSAKSGQEKHGSSRVTVGNPFFTDPKHGDFSLSTAAKALPTVALPANVAAALGVAAGTTPSSGASF